MIDNDQNPVMMPEDERKCIKMVEDELLLCEDPPHSAEGVCVDTHTQGM